MTTDIEGWGAPERIGLRREAGDRAVLGRAGVLLILFGAVLLGLGAHAGLPGFDALEPLGSDGVRWSALLCVAGGAVALLVARASSFWNRIR